MPDYEPGFWDRLEAQLVAGGAGQDADRFESAPALASVIDGGPVDRAVELAAAVPSARRRALGGRRRSVLVLAAAAAVVVAVVAIAIRPGPDGVRTAAHTAGRPAATTPGAAGQGNATTTVVGRSPAPGSTALGTSLGAAPITDGSTSTPQGAFVAWASAVHAGDATSVLALTGPRTARYEDALGVSVAERVAGWVSAWGDWAAGAQRRIDVVELGEVSGQRVVGVVLRRPAAGTKYGERYDALPMVLDSGGWKVEPAGFDPATGGRLEIVSPTPGQDGLQPLPRNGVVSVAANGTGGLCSASTSRRGPTSRWPAPSTARSPGTHPMPSSPRAPTCCSSPTCPTPSSPSRPTPSACWADREVTLYQLRRLRRRAQRGCLRLLPASPAGRLGPVSG